MGNANTIDNNSQEDITTDKVGTGSGYQESQSSETTTNQSSEYQQSEIDKTSSQTGEYLVCQGATCLCDQGQKIHLKLSVLSNKKVFLNDSSALATIDDNILSGTFNTCKLNPASGKPCQYQPGNKWDWKSGIQDYFSEVNGKKFLTENAFLRCPVFPGILNVSYNGQEIDVPESDKKDLDSSVDSSIICLLDENVEPTDEMKQKKPNITSLSIKIGETDTTATTAAIKKIILRQNKEYTFTAKDKNSAGYNYWYIREKEEKDNKAKEISYSSDKGSVYSQTGTVAKFAFKQARTFYLEAFGTLNGKKKIWNSSSFEIEVIDKNTIIGIELTPRERVKSDESTFQLEANTTYNIKLHTLLPIEDEDMDDLTVEIHDTSIRFVPPGAEDLLVFKGNNALSFSLKTSKWGEYTLQVKRGNEIVNKYHFPIIENEVKKIKIISPKVGGQGWVRPGTRVTFEAELSDNKDSSKRIVWQLNESTLAGEYEKQLKQTFTRVARHVIKASYKGLLNFKYSKTESCPIEVRPNEITAITADKDVKALSIGTSVTFAVDTPYIDLTDNEYIKWEFKSEKPGKMIPGKTMTFSLEAANPLPVNNLWMQLSPLMQLNSPIQLGNNTNKQKDLSIQFNQLGTYSLGAIMGENGRFKTPTIIEVVQSHIEAWSFCDKEGNKQSQIGWQLDFHIRLKIRGCENRKIKIIFWYDSRDKDLKNRFHKIDAADIEKSDFTLREGGVGHWKISSAQLWISLKKLVDNHGSGSKTPKEYARIFFTVLDLDTLCDNNKAYPSGHPLYRHIYPLEVDGTTAYIPNKTDYKGLFLDANNKPLTDIISYTDVAYMSLQRINSPEDTKCENLELRLIENIKGPDITRMRVSIPSFDKQGYIKHPVNIVFLAQNKGNQSPTKPRFFYMQLINTAKKDKSGVIYTYPEGYKTGSENDSEIIELEKDDHTSSDTKQMLGNKIIVSNARLIHNLKQLDPMLSSAEKKEFDEDAYNRQTAETVNKAARGRNTETLDKSKNYFLQLKITENPEQQKSRYNRTGKQVGVAGTPCTNCGECVCKKYNLVWGAKVSCEFRKKVVTICKELWGEDKKIEMANGLMAVMAVETARSFKAHIIMGKQLKANASDVVATDFENWVKKRDGKGNVITNEKGEPVLILSSRAVGLLQFTQSAFESFGLFTRGTGFTSLHKAKLKFAQMGEIDQLNYVKQYLSRGKKDIIIPEDIYIYVFAPDRIKLRNPDDVLYDEKIDGEKYTQNKSVDTSGKFEKDKNGVLKEVGDGKIVRKELLARFYKLYDEGKGENFFTGKCENFEEDETKSTEGWHDPVDNPYCTIYMQNGGGPEENIGGDRWGLFGKVRGTTYHAGLDLFAEPGTSIYACVDAYVYQRLWMGGYGNSLVLKVKDKEAFLKLKKDYKLKFESLGEKKNDTGYNENGDIYLFYAHLKSVKDFYENQEVKAGTILGETGVSGVKNKRTTEGYGTRAPHLHFEIYTLVSGNKKRIHPGFFVKFKHYSEQSQTEIKRQTDKKNESIFAKGYSGDGQVKALSKKK